MKLTIVWYVLGLFVFYFIADYSVKEWANIYYLWDKGKDLVFSLAAYQLAVRWRPYIIPVIVFSLIRVLWELAAWILEVNINNSRAIDWIFLLLPMGLVWIYLNELGRCRKSNLLSAWLMPLGILLLASWGLIGFFLLSK